MDIVKVLESQYTAGLNMLEHCIKTCPDDLWVDASYTNRFWHLAFHTLFYTHLYLHDSEHDFEAWEKHLEQYEYLKFRSENHAEDAAMYMQEDILEYLTICRNKLAGYLPTVAFEEESGFSWLPFSKLEHHLYNIRHLQHHTGQLGDRLRESKDIAVRWVGKG